MRMDTPVANGDPTLAALIPEGVTLAHIIALFQEAYPINGVQLLRARLGATHPANLAPPELAEFIKYVLAALKSAGIRDPAALLADRVRREAEAAAAKLGSSAAIGDVAAEQKSDGHAPVTIENNSSTIPKHRRRGRWHKSLHTGRRKPGTSGSLTSRPRISCRGRLPILKRALLRRPLLATRSLSTTDTFSASVALLKCSAAACGRCNAGARKGKAPRPRR